jgi:hypothetical protein
MQLSIGLVSLRASTGQAGFPGRLLRLETIPCLIDASTLFRPSALSSPKLRSVSADGLSGWQGEQLDPPYHRREEAARQMALRQQKSVVSCMLHQAAARFTTRGCRLVSDHLSILLGSTRRRHRFPRL